MWLMVATRYIKIQSEQTIAEQVREAAECLKNGGLVAFPTETVYGIGVNLDLPDSVKRLLEIRQSPQDKNISIHIADKNDVFKYVKQPIPTRAHRLMQKFWPGPLTIVLASLQEGETVGIRFPNHPVAIEIIKQAGAKVGVPSANLSGKPPAINAQQVKEIFDGKIEYIIDYQESRHKTSSTVAKVSKNKIDILREGAIPKELILEHDYTYIVFVCAGNTCRSPMAEVICKSLLAKKFNVDKDNLQKVGFKILSAGTSAPDQHLASETAIKALKDIGYDLSTHLTRLLTPEIMQDADYIFVMASNLIENVKNISPENAYKVSLLDPDGKDVNDPLSGDVEVYKQCAFLIKRLVKKRLDQIFKGQL